MILLFIVLFVGTLLVQGYLRNTYAKWGRVPAASGLTGAQTARAILDANGLHDVRVVEVPGQLTDHYDPRKKVVSLSPANFRGATVAAHAVAAHEVGHAIQHANGYAPLQVRTALVPVATLGANFAPWLIILGAFIGALGLVQLGVLLFGAAVLFQIVTLPVEFNASSRAADQLATLGIATTSEVGGTRQVLNAAALTYVAAAAGSIMYLLYYLSIFMGNRD
ncbi:MAG TPA: zinc metallopeptidase [Trueperaceae bacterium]|nr:zinc metallopeptidase [Trueperaceae bacterium]